MLKKIRVGISILFFLFITFYFIDFARLLPDEFHVLAHIQLVPAILGASFGIILFLLLLTFIFGRVYCSSICPMGVLQDIIGWISKRFSKKKKKYTYSKPKTILRWSVLVSAFLLFFLGFSTLLGLIDPYSAFGRIATHLFKPAYQGGNNLLASIFTQFNNYTFYKVDIVILSLSSFIISIVTLLSIGFFAWKYGRTFCNTVCPVGTILGFISRYSFFKIRVDSEKCNHCGLCASSCKASCINSREGEIDHSRCVACFNCLGSCKRGALKFSYPVKKTVEEQPENANEQIDTGKRKFLLAGVAATATLPSVIEQQRNRYMHGKDVLTRQIAISPPGAKSAEHLLHHCSSCHLCISKCPSNVLKPAFMEYGLGGMMQPMMYFEKGYCNYDCVVCSTVCPNHALAPLTKGEKHKTQVGHVVLNENICIVHTDGTNCGACAEHCPTQAVTMIPYENGLTTPYINTEICIGCGGCEFICPVRPHRAIFVEGNREHREAKITASEATEVDVDELDFGF